MSIDKKINYEDQRLTEKQKKKIKPVNQGGGPNYLGKQETVTVPKKWLSDPNHVVAELAYITPKEKKILLEKNLYGSLKGKPNRGPGGVQSLQGDMGSVGGGPSSSGGDGLSARDRHMGLQGKTGKTDKSLGDGGVDRSKVSQFSEYGKNLMASNLSPPSLASRIGNFINPRSILSGILGLINPALGLGFRAIDYLKAEIPETLGQFKDSKTLQEFRDKVRGYGITNPTISNNPMFGGIESLAVNPQITNTTPGLDFINAPQNIEGYNTITTSSANPQDYDFLSNAMAFKPGSIKDRALKQQYGIYNATGIMNSNMIDLMKQDIELNKQKGTPLSLPAEAYSLIG